MVGSVGWWRPLWWGLWGGGDPKVGVGGGGDPSVGLGDPNSGVGDPNVGDCGVVETPKLGWGVVETPIVGLETPMLGSVGW